MVYTYISLMVDAHCVSVFYALGGLIDIFYFLLSFTEYILHIFFGGYFLPHFGVSHADRTFRLNDRLTIRNRYKKKTVCLILIVQLARNLREVEKKPF